MLTNGPQNFSERCVEFRAFLRDSSADAESLGAHSKRLMEGARVDETALCWAADESWGLHKDQYLPSLIPLLEGESFAPFGGVVVGRWFLIKHPELVAQVVPFLRQDDFNGLLKQCLVKGRDELFDTLLPYMGKASLCPDLLLLAGERDCRKFGQFLIEQVDVFEALKASRYSSGKETVAAWWAQAISEGRAHVPDLGKRPGYWLKRFPVLRACVREEQLESRLPPPAPRSRGPRF